MGLYKCARQVAHAAEEAKNEAENALKFLTEEAWPEMQKTLEEMRDTVTFAAHMVVLLVALYVCIYASLKIRELILSSGVPAFVKTIVNGMCLGFLLIVFTLIFIMIFHLFLEMDLYDYTVVFIKEFWNWTLLFTFTSYCLLKSHLVEWACRRSLKDRVRIVQHRDPTDGTSSARITDSDKTTKKNEGELNVVTKGDLAEISQLLVSQVINVLTSSVSLLSMWETREDVLYSKSPILLSFVHIPAWYMVYDSFAMFDSYTLRKNLKHLSLARQLYIFARKKSGLLFHHAILFFGGYPLVLNYSIRRGAGDFVIALFFLMEVTNPFLSAAMILRILGLTHTSFYFINGVILLVLWFFVRVLNYPIALLLYAVQYHDWNIFSALGGMGTVCHPFCLLHFGFQTYWFIQIFKISIRTAMSKSKKIS